LLLTTLLCRYQPPFDTHRWLVNRCGTEITYIIDFYTGSSKPRSLPSNIPGEAPMVMPAADLSFFLDVRPAVDGFEGLKMRLGLGRKSEED
jgi:cytochrome c heme-lyase